MMPHFIDPAVNNLSNQLELSAFDQILRLYVHKVFCFPFPDHTRRTEAVTHLERSLSAAILRWPFITGRVGPQGSDAPNILKLRYPTPRIGQIEHEILQTKELSCDKFPWTYQELVEAGMPPKVMDLNLLSTVPEWPKSGESYPALAIQANFIEGGLLLCFAFHHSVADGASFTTFIQEFAGGTKKAPKKDSFVRTPVRQRLEAPQENQVYPLDQFPEYNYKAVPARPVASGPCTTRILTFSADRIEKLEKNASKCAKSLEGDQARVSTISCLSSLIWVAVMRARRGRLLPSETAKIGIAVNVRRFINLHENYFGNAIVHTNATAKVGELVDGEVGPGAVEQLPPIQDATVALGALRMCQATHSIDDDYVTDRLKAFSELSDPTEVSNAFARAMDNTHTGLDFSDWRGQGADLDFDIPGAETSKLHFWRKAWSPNEGAYNVLPRKGPSRGPSDWEVSLGLSVVDMEHVCADLASGGWLSREPVEGMHATVTKFSGPRAREDSKF